jgi:hypothetical protein
MNVANEHNLPAGGGAGELHFGIRVSFPPDDPFTRLVGADWQNVLWFATSEERDRALADMASRHRFSRIGDVPSIVLEPIER